MPRRAESSAKAERDQLRDRMRELSCSLPQIAAEMGRRFKLRPRVAWRHALGWPQWKLAQQYNTLHPGAKLSDHRVSEYETWPHGGSPPSLRYLARLATTYGHGCTVSQLVDADDLEHLAPVDRCLLTTATTGHAAPARPPVPSQPDAELAASTEGFPETLTTLLRTFLNTLAPSGPGRLITPRERDHAYHQLVQFLRSWAHNMDRRKALRMLGWAATAASVYPVLDGDEQQRIAAVIGTPSRVDAQTIEHIEAVLWRCRQQDYALGPQAALDTVLAQRNLAHALVPECPEPLRPRILSALSEASRQAGWLSFDLKQFDDAGYFYEDARALAHEAHNVGLGAFVLCEMSHLSTEQGRPRIGIDHAVAAEQWARHTDDMLLRAYTADVLARAYAADGQQPACLTALDSAHAALAAASEKIPGYGPTYDEAIHIAIRGGCHLKLGEVDQAISYTQQSIKALDRSYARDMAITIVDLSNAYIHIKEIDEAARLLGDAGEIAALNSSARLLERLKRSRTELQSWAHTTPVRQLDDRLAAYGMA